MSTPEHDEPDPAGRTPPAQGGGPAAAVDVRAVAERVYQLMLAEARLERARGATRTARG